MSKSIKKIGIIPARFASTRFPGKPLVNIHGKSMIQRVYEQVVQSDLDEVIVATDDQRIIDHVNSFGGNVKMTSVNHLTGTDRCNEIASQYPDETVVINIQGDEPFIHPNQINELLKVFNEDESIEIATQCKLIEQNDIIFDSNAIKVVRDKANKAIYFSRNPIPFIRNLPPSDWSLQRKHYKHIGIYGYKKHILEKLAQQTAGILETAESLEQLRWMENGFKIHVEETQYDTFGIDVPEDLEKIVF